MHTRPKQAYVLENLSRVFIGKDRHGRPRYVIDGQNVTMQVISLRVREDIVLSANGRLLSAQREVPAPA